MTPHTQWGERSKCLMTSTWLTVPSLMALSRAYSSSSCTPVDGAVLPGLTPLPQRFRALFVRAQQEQAATAASLFIDAAAVAHALLTDQRERCVLHGDLHHENLKYSQQRSWLAIDPKGLIGEPAYDAAHVM